jgi:predicted DNA binding CopG/RHH family protein
MKRSVPRVTTDEQVEAFLEQDLSDLDYSQFKPMKFEFENRAARLNMRLPATLMEAVKSRAKARGVPYTRFIREILEAALTKPTGRRRRH